jgi:hypothetical protein
VPCQDLKNLNGIAEKLTNEWFLRFKRGLFRDDFGELRQGMVKNTIALGLFNR